MIRVAFVIGDYPPEQRKLREDTAKSYSSAEVEVGIVSVAPTPFGGLGPAEIQLVAPYFHDACIEPNGRATTRWCRSACSTSASMAAARWSTSR